MPAVHGPWCGAKTWPTKCPSCSERVFFFQCDCGSRVFFDKLGEPWPLHDCFTSWTRGLKRRRGRSGSVTVELSRNITVYRPPDGSISAEVVSTARRRQEHPDPIVSVSPSASGKAIAVIGFVREIYKQVDVITSLNLQDSSMTAAFLGPLGQGRWGKVTIHAPSRERDVLHSYTAWVKSDDLISSNHSRGITVMAKLRGFSVPGRDIRVWVCDEYEVFR